MIYLNFWQKHTSKSRKLRVATNFSCGNWLNWEFWNVRYLSLLPDLLSFWHGIIIKLICKVIVLQHLKKDEWPKEIHSLKEKKKSHIWETLNLSMCADSSTNTIKYRFSRKEKEKNIIMIRFQLSYFMCHVSCGFCCLSLVICH